VKYKNKVRRRRDEMGLWGWERVSKSKGRVPIFAILGFVTSAHIRAL
jgi:hypothetical protein